MTSNTDSSATTEMSAAIDTTPTSEADDASRTALWQGDTGALAENSRRALLQLIRGPYLSGESNRQLWSSLLADEAAIRSRLNELFLDLVIDRDAGFAFVRNVSTDEMDVPKTVRSENLTFMDTAMLLILRQSLLTAEHDQRVIVGREEVFEQLRVYRTADRDESDFTKRMNASWSKMRNKLRVIHPTNTDDDEDRAEISPVLRLIMNAEQVRGIADEYRRLADVGAGGYNESEDAEEGL